MEISDIKGRLSLLEVLQSYSLSSDKNNRLKCPWHNDKSPSLQVYPKTNTWTCFSTKCNAGSGDDATSLDGSFGNEKNLYFLRKVKARLECTEVAWIFFGVHTANAVKIAKRRIMRKQKLGQAA